jgi:predicted ester cyclase
MSTEGNKAVYKRMIEEAFNAGDLSVVDEVVSPNYVLHGAPPNMPKGPDAIRSTVQTFRTAFPDLRIELQELVAEGDKVTARAVMHGTHDGVCSASHQPTRRWRSTA